MIHASEELLRTIAIGPLSIFFTNVNKAMGIPGHSHFAEVKIVFQTTGPIGFPVFADTVGEIQKLLFEKTQAVFRDSTNEDVESRLWEALEQFVENRDQNPILAKWGGDYQLLAVEVAVRGVPDRIGHSDGFARYTIQRAVIVKEE